MTNKGLRPTLVEEPLSPRDNYLAANPEAARLQKAQIREIMRRIGNYAAGFGKVIGAVVANANQALEAGILLRNFEESLPGKTLTLDFYTQMQAAFVDGHGQQVTFDQLHWLIRLARNHPEPFKEIGEVLQYRQPWLLASGQFKLEGQRSPQTAHDPPGPVARLKNYFDLGLAETVKELRGQAEYCPDGEHLRDDLVAVLREDLKPKLEMFDATREWLRQEIGI